MGPALRFIVLIVGVACAGWFGWQRMFPDDRAQIRAVLDDIAEGVSGGGDQGVNRLTRIASLRNQLDPEVTVDAGAPFRRLEGRDAILGTAATLGGSAPGLQLRLREIAISLEPDRQTARTVLLAEARMTDAAGEDVFDAREFSVMLRRLDGKWVVSAVSLIRALEPVDAR